MPEFHCVCQDQIWIISDQWSTMETFVIGITQNLLGSALTNLFDMGIAAKDISIHLTLPYSGLRGVLLIFLKVKPVLIKNLSWWSLKKQWKNNSKVGGNSFKGFPPIFSAFSVGLFTIFWLILTKYWQFDEKGGTLTQ